MSEHINKHTITFILLLQLPPSVFAFLTYCSPEIPIATITKPSSHLIATESSSSFYLPHSRPERWVAGARNSEFIWKLVSLFRRWCSNVPKNHLPWVRIQASFILRGEVVGLVVANSLVLESLVLEAVHLGLITRFLQTSKKTNYSPFYNFYLSMNGKVLIPLEVKLWEWATLHITGSRQHSFNDSSGAKATKCKV